MQKEEGVRQAESEANRQELDALLTDLSLIRINRYTDARMLQLNLAQTQRMSHLVLLGSNARLLAPMNRLLIDNNGKELLITEGAAGYARSKRNGSFIQKHVASQPDFSCLTKNEQWNILLDKAE